MILPCFVYSQHCINSRHSGRGIFLPCKTEINENYTHLGVHIIHHSEWHYSILYTHVISIDMHAVMRFSVLVLWSSSY